MPRDSEVYLEDVPELIPQIQKVLNAMPSDEQ